MKQENVIKPLEKEEVQGPYELPEGWRWMSLGKEEITDIIMGQSPPSTTYNQEGLGLPFYQGKADFGEAHPTPRIWCIQPNKIAEVEDILISVRAPVGPVNLCIEKSCIGRGLAAIRPRKERLDNLFLFYHLKAVEDNWTGKGSTFGAIKKRDLQNLQIPLPPLEEQRYIVARIKKLFSKLDEIKKLRRETSEKAKAMLPSALHEVFSKADEKGWKWVELGKEEITDIIMGQSPPSTTYNQEGLGLPFYQGKADFGEAHPTPRIWCIQPNKIAEVEDILISVRAPVGPVNLCIEKSCIGRGLAAIRPRKERLDNLFLFYHLKAVEDNWTGKGSTFGAIKKRDLQNLQIALPSLSEQKRIVVYLDKIQIKAKMLQKLQERAEEKINKLRASILNQAFMGEL